MRVGQNWKGGAQQMCVTGPSCGLLSLYMCIGPGQGDKTKSSCECLLLIFLSKAIPLWPCLKTFREGIELVPR